MTFLLNPGASRSLSRARAGPAALAVRSSDAAPWAALRRLSNVTKDDFIRQVVSNGLQSPQGGANPCPSSSVHDGPGSTPTGSTGQGSSPSIIRKVQVPLRFGRIKNDPTSTSPDGLQRQEARKEHVRLTPSHYEPLIRKYPVSDKRTNDPLIRKYPISDKRTNEPLIRKHTVGYKSNPNKSLIRKYEIPDKKPWKLPAQNWAEKPPAVFSRPHVVILRKLPPETKPGDIIQAISKVTEAGMLPQRASRISDVRVMPRSEDESFSAARVEFLHPESAKTIHDLVAKGDLQVRGVVPVASLFQDRDPPKLRSDSDLGATSPGEDRREYFTHPDRLKIVRRTHLIYN